MPRPLIFLDIDGVLNGHNFDDHPGVFSNPIDRECVEALNRLIVAVDPEIVLSSAWRYMIHGGAMTLKGFEYLLRTHGVMANDRLIGLTPTDEEIPTRGLQVRDWLNTHGGRPYVVIDDGGCVPGTDQWCDMGLSIHPVVWTRGNIGLTDFEVAKAIEILSPPTPDPPLTTPREEMSMSNLRSDCRDLVAKYDYTLPSDQPYPATTTEMLTLRAHMERACHQIDHVEELWHQAERRAHGLELALIVLMRQFPRDDPHRKKAGDAIAKWGNPSAVMRLAAEEGSDVPDC